MSKNQGVVFDMDGVLIDSYEAHFMSWQQAGGAYGLEMSREQFIATFGRTSREVIRELWGDRITTAEAVAELDDRKEAAFRELIERDFPAMDGAGALIDQLHESGFHLALGSSAPPENVTAVLNRLERQHCFEAIVTGADVTKGKPHPEVFLIAAARLGLAPERCLVIEDAPAGIEAAHAAGMPSVAVASTGRNAAQLAAAERVIHKLSELDGKAIERIIDSGKA